MATPGIRISALLILLFLALAALFVACGDDDDKPGSGASVAGCEALDHVDSYRYTVSLKLQSAVTPTPSRTAAPLSAFADALNALFSDFTLSGAYRAPDRSQAILRFQNEELELRTIGNQSWVRLGSNWQEEKMDAGGSLLTPTVICRDLVSPVLPSLRNVTPRAETVNGIDVNHYALNDANLGHLPQVLGQPPPEKYLFDLWLANQGQWPVRVNIRSSETNEKGQPLGFQLSMDVRDVNDKGILIDAPAVAASSP